MSQANEQAAALQDILKSSTESAMEYLSRAIPVLENNLSVLRSDDPSKGMAVINDSVDGLQWLMEFAELAGKANETQPVLSMQFADIEDSLAKSVQLIVEAMTALDHPLLADVMEFELIATLHDMQALVTHTLADLH